MKQIYLDTNSNHFMEFSSKCSYTEKLKNNKKKQPTERSLLTARYHMMEARGIVTPPPACLQHIPITTLLNFVSSVYGYCLDTIYGYFLDIDIYLNLTSTSNL